MALPTSGPLSFSQIATEIYGSTGTNRSLHTMSLAAGKTTPDTVSEFYGYSGGASISLSTNYINQSNPGGLGFVTLTASGPWQAIASNPDLILESYSTSGSGSQKVTFSTNAEFEFGCTSASITYAIVGSPGVNTTLFIEVDGYSVPCA